MTAPHPNAARLAVLADLETRLAAGEGGFDLALARADLLAQLGRAEAARAAYMDLVTVQPTHLALLKNLGALVHAQGYTSAARTLYAQAAQHHPGDPDAQVNLGNCLAEAGDRDGAQAAFAAALAADPGHRPAHRGLARLAAGRADGPAAQRHLRAAFEGAPTIERPYRGEGRPITVLMLISGLPGDIPLQHILGADEFHITALAPQFHPAGAPLPPHDLVFNGVGDADLCAEALEAGKAVAAGTDRKVLNLPAAALRTGRAENARRLRTLAGVRIAKVREMTKAQAAGLRPESALAALGFRLPLLLRAPGFHGGEAFEMAASLAELRAAVERLPGDTLLMMDFIDTRGRDGLYRKYRAMIVGDRLHPLHLAVSDTWKVHFATAGMAEATPRRTEDAGFLADMGRTIGPGAMAALERVRQALGLDYGGIDFGLTGAGEVVVFEANATMVIPTPPPDPIWDYRRRTVEALMEAVRALVREAAGR